MRRARPFRRSQPCDLRPGQAADDGRAGQRHHQRLAGARQHGHRCRRSAGRTRSSECAPCPRLNAASVAATTLAQHRTQHQHARRQRVDQPRAGHAQQRQRRLHTHQHGARCVAMSNGCSHDAMPPSRTRPRHPQEAQRHPGVDQPPSVVLEGRRRHSPAWSGLPRPERVVPNGPAARVPRRGRFPARGCTRCGRAPFGAGE